MRIHLSLSRLNIYISANMFRLIFTKLDVEEGFVASPRDNVISSQTPPRFPLSFSLSVATHDAIGVPITSRLNASKRLGDRALTKRSLTRKRRRSPSPVHPRRKGGRKDGGRRGRRAVAGGCRGGIPNRTEIDPVARSLLLPG